MMTSTKRARLLASLLTLSAVACGGPEQEPTREEGSSAAGVESNTEAVISGASRGSTIKATANVNLRTGPSTSYSVILTVPAGKTATVLSGTPSNGYYKVNYQGYVGWTHGDYWNVVPGLVVNGWTLNTYQDKWVRWIAANTVPKLQGTRDTRLTVASRVTWWSLKEGVLDLANPHAYSNCHYSTGDKHIGPLETCPSGQPWQVGIAGIQATYQSLSTVQNTALTLYSGMSIRDVLDHTANIAGYADGTSTWSGIVNSTGDLQKSWLLRNHAVGTTRQEPIVTNECINNSYGWCYSPDWYPSSRFAPNRTEALESIRELQAILDGLAP